MANEPSRVRKGLKIIGGVFAVAAVALTIATVWINLRGRAAERAVLAELEQAGLWPRVEVEPPVAVARWLDLADAVKPGDGLVAPPPFGLSDTHFGVAIDPATAAALAEYVAAHGEALQQVADALTAGELDLPQSYLGDAGFRVPGAMRSVARAIIAWSLHEQAQGNGDAAVDRLILLTRLRQAGRGGGSLRFLSNVAIDALLYDYVHELLGRCRPSDEAIERLLAAMQAIDRQAELVIVQREQISDAAHTLVTIDQYVPDVCSAVPGIMREMHATGLPASTGFFNGDLRHSDPLIGVLPEGWRNDTIANATLDTLLTRAGFFVWPGRWRRIQADVVRGERHMLELFSITSDVWSDPQTHDHHLVRVSYDLEVAHRVVGWALSIEQYRLAYGTWPTTSPDPQIGEVLIYRRLDEGVLLYHPGRDGTDDGGIQDRLFARDITFRLLDPATRSTLAPPEPTPPPEVGDDEDVSP